MSVRIHAFDCVIIKILSDVCGYAAARSSDTLLIGQVVSDVNTTCRLTARPTGKLSDDYQRGQSSHQPFSGEMKHQQGLKLPAGTLEVKQSCSAALTQCWADERWQHSWGRSASGISFEAVCRGTSPLFNKTNAMVDFTSMTSHNIRTAFSGTRLHREIQTVAAAFSVCSRLFSAALNR